MGLNENTARRRKRSEGEDGVTVTSGLHAEAERINKQRGERGLVQGSYIVTSRLNAHADVYYYKQKREY